MSRLPFVKIARRVGIGPLNKKGLRRVSGDGNHRSAGLVGIGPLNKKGLRLLQPD